MKKHYVPEEPKLHKVGRNTKKHIDKSLRMLYNRDIVNILDDEFDDSFYYEAQQYNELKQR